MVTVRETRVLTGGTFVCHHMLYKGTFNIRNFLFGNLNSQLNLAWFQTIVLTNGAQGTTII